MSKYRIKVEYGDEHVNRYIVQKKRFFGLWWSNCVRVNGELYDYPKRFLKYEDAKKQLESNINWDEKQAKHRAAKKAFKPKYYYPPLPDVEPME
jgi:hypothetical protein